MEAISALASLTQLQHLSFGLINREIQFTYNVACLSALTGLQSLSLLGMKLRGGQSAEAQA